MSPINANTSISTDTNDSQPAFPNVYNTGKYRTRIPEEIVEYIFLMLAIQKKGEKHLANFLRVSKAWNDIGQSSRIWQQVARKHFLPIKNPKEAFKEMTSFFNEIHLGKKLMKEKKWEDAERCLKPAAQRAYPDAINCMIAISYNQHDANVRQSWEQLRSLRELATWPGGLFPEAVHQLVGHFYFGNQPYTEQSYEQAVLFCELSANQGNAKAQNKLGDFYHRGKGVEQSYKQAAKWYKLAAAQGLAAAQNNFGHLHQYGKGVEQSDKQAAELLTLAANEKFAPAQNNLGWLYQKGRGVEQSDKQAAELLTLAANQQFAPAQFNLGHLYEQGKGVEQSDVEAAKWYKLAAAQGLAKAQHKLGWLYQKGRGVEQSDAQAVEWYKLAAAQGFAQAQHNLARLYADGKGVEKSIEQARYWAELALKNGSAHAQKLLDYLSANSTPVTGKRKREDIK